MKLKAKKVSDRTVTVEFDGAAQGLVATVRYVSPEHRRELHTRATRNGRTDWDKFFRLLCETMVIELSGLTPSILDSLVELDDESERPPVRDDGTVEATPELVWFLWQNAQASRFQEVLSRASDAILEEIALEKKRTGVNSGV